MQTARSLKERGPRQNLAQPIAPGRRTYGRTIAWRPASDRSEIRTEQKRLGGGPNGGKTVMNRIRSNNSGGSSGDQVIREEIIRIRLTVVRESRFIIRYTPDKTSRLHLNAIDEKSQGQKRIGNVRARVVNS